MMGGYGGYGMFGGGGFGWLFMILWWVLIIGGIVVLVRWFFSSSSRGRSGSTRSALDILKDRYARGEIDREQYEQMRRDLER